ncbi:MAG: hypothetical protein WCE49_11470 [Terrimicrobiaceae bacterium]
MENSPRSPGLRIGQMSLRVPGGDAGAGHRIAQQTGELLAAGSAGLAGQHLGTMRLRVPAAPGASEAAIARAVSRAILDRLKSPSDA